MKGSFDNAAIVRVRIESDTNGNDGKPFGWAYADVERKKLPKDFQSLTYLEFSSYADLTGGTLQTSKWLCEFYKKYESAQPKGRLSYGCKD